MGCSSSKSTGILKKKSTMFDKEVYGYKKTTNLLNVKNNTHYEIINSEYPHFYEEKMESGREKAAVRPWLANILPPEHEIVENTELPKYSLKIDHVFGFRNDDTRQNVFFLSEDQIIYTTSSLAIIQNIDDLSQTIFGGNSNTGKMTCHNNDIMSIAVYSKDISMVATGQRALKPLILVWSPSDPNVIFAKFHQANGSKEVSGLDFDPNGIYLGSFGKDEGNSFYIFNLQTKSLYWTQETGELALLDLKFDPYNDSFCVCGYGKIIFAGLSKNQCRHIITETSNQNLSEEIFTTISYINQKYCAIGSFSGKVYIFRYEKHHKTLTPSGSVMSIKYNYDDQLLFVSTSKKKIHIYSTRRKHFSKVDSFNVNSIVTSIDINNEDVLLIGSKNGNIELIHYKESPIRKQIICQSHSSGEVRGLDFVSDKHAITTAEDNKIMIWNLRTHLCENIGDIDYGYNGDDSIEQKVNEKKKKKKKKANTDVLGYEFKSHQKSWAVSYNKQKGHVAIGICNGSVSIRLSIKKINELVVPDIIISEVEGNLVTNVTEEEDEETNKYISDTGRAITELKYTNYGDLLAVACENGILTILNVNERYTVIKQIVFDSFITNLDWDLTNTYVQVVTVNNRFMFIDYNTSTIKSKK